LIPEQSVSADSEPALTKGAISNEFTIMVGHMEQRAINPRTRGDIPVSTPVIVLGYLTAKQRRAPAIANNQLP
jgi:hypothetical protein